MSGDTVSEVKVELVEGVKGDIAELTAVPANANATQRENVEALKHRIAELFVECQRNSYAGELMGRGGIQSWPIAAEFASISPTIKESFASA